MIRERMTRERIAELRGKSLLVGITPRLWLNERLDALEEIADSHRRIIAGECAPDEKHCTCVPALRMEIERLRAALKPFAKVGRRSWVASDHDAAEMLGLSGVEFADAAAAEAVEGGNG